MYFNLFNFNFNINKKYVKSFKDVFPFIFNEKKLIYDDYHIKFFLKKPSLKILRNSYRIKSGYVKIEKEKKYIKVFLLEKVHFPEFLSRLFIFLIKSEGVFFKTFLIHSASILINNEVILIPGVPSSGKTTLSNFIKNIFYKESTILNDDLTLCSYNKEKKIFEAYRIPLIDDLKYGSYYFNGPYSIRRIIFPNIDKNSYVKVLKPSECLNELLKDNAFINAMDKKDLSLKVKYYKKLLKTLSLKISSSVISYNLKKDKNFVKNIIM